MAILLSWVSQVKIRATGLPGGLMRISGKISSQVSGQSEEELSFLEVEGSY